jgi:large repetitive protein
VPTAALTTPNATASDSDNGACLGCGVNNPGFVTDTDLTNFAAINVPLNLLGNESLTVTNNATITPGSGGLTVGFLLQVPKSVLTLSLLQNVSVTTLKGGQNTNDPALLKLDLLELLGDDSKGFLNVNATLPFDGVRVTDGGLLSLLGQLNVYAACVAQPQSQ